MKVKIAHSIDKEMIERVQELAKKDRRSRSSMVELLLEKGLEVYDKV